MSLHLHLPPDAGDLPVGIEIHNSVAVCAADQRVAIIMTNGSEGPGVNLVLGITRDGRVQLAQNLG